MRERENHASASKFHVALTHVAVSGGVRLAGMVRLSCDATGREESVAFWRSADGTTTYADADGYGEEERVISALAGLCGVRSDDVAESDWRAVQTVVDRAARKTSEFLGTHAAEFNDAVGVSPAA